MSTVTARLPSHPTLEGHTYLDEIGSGGMARVHLYSRKTTGTLIALKVMKDAPGLSTIEQVALMERERESLWLMRGDRGFVQILGRAKYKGKPAYLMEYIEGGNLLHYVRRNGAMDARAAGKFGIELAEIVQRMHNKGILHRDLSHKNILVRHRRLAGRRSSASPVPEPVISDLGLAKPMFEMAITSSNCVMGTPDFMAPECFLGAWHARPTTDVYSLGAILYFVLTGKLPVENPWKQVSEGVSEVFVTPSTFLHTIPYEMDAIVLRCLQFRATDRFQSAENLAKELMRFLIGQRLSHKTRSFSPGLR